MLRFLEKERFNGEYRKIQKKKKKIKDEERKKKVKQILYPGG